MLSLCQLLCSVSRKSLLCSTTVFLNPFPSPNHLAQRSTLPDLRPDVLSREGVSETNPKELLKREGQKGTKLEKEKYSVLKDTLIATFANIYSL